MERRIYANAPITEAIIDLRVRLPDPTSLAQLERLQEAVRDQYPGKTSRNQAVGRFEIGQQISASASQLTLGYLFRSTDKRQVFQARLDGFTFSRLNPYESWEPFRDEAKRLWDHYSQCLKPQEITRLAVRYINRIDLPLPVEKLSRYLRTSPEISPDLPQELAGFFLQMAIPQTDIGSIALLNETLADSIDHSRLSVVLDIDIFRQNDVPQTDSQVWQFFEVLHQRKNDVFEACITDEARELFK